MVGRDDCLVFVVREQVARGHRVSVHAHGAQDGTGGDAQHPVQGDGLDVILVLLPELLQSVHWHGPFVVVSL